MTSYWLNKNRSEETKLKISLSKIGSIPWNKGLKGCQVSWNKGTKGIMKPNSGSFYNGMKIPLKRRIKISESLRGKNIWSKGCKISESTKRKIAIWNVNHPNPSFKETETEKKLESELIRLGIEYEKQVPLCDTAIVDFLIPKVGVVIQVDGCYWHGCKKHFPKMIKRQKRDRYQDKILSSKGYKIIRLWGCDINESLSKCSRKISKVI